MLELRPTCECCDTALPADATDARIGSSSCPKELPILGGIPEFDGQATEPRDRGRHHVAGHPCDGDGIARMIIIDRSGHIVRIDRGDDLAGIVADIDRPLPASNDAGASARASSVRP